MTISIQPDKNEATLIARLRVGDEDAVRQWYQFYESKLKQFLINKISNEEDSAELIQEIFIACLRELIHFRGESSLQTWMFTIARHKVADFYRAKYAKKVIHLVTLLDTIELPSGGTAQDQIHAVRDALQALAPESRELLLAKYLDNKTVRDLASDFSITVKAAESMLFRARHAFRTAYSLAVSES